MRSRPCMADAACRQSLNSPPCVVSLSDATGCVCFLPRENDGVLLGAAITAATAACIYPSLIDAMARMTHIGRTITNSPADSAISRYHQRKYAVFLKMHENQQEWKRIMKEEEEAPLRAEGKV
jgi:ribulose kinase